MQRLKRLTFYDHSCIRISFLIMLVFWTLQSVAITRDIQSGDSLIDKNGFKSIITERNIVAGKKFTTPLHPQAVSFTQEYIRKQGKELEKMKIWGKPYFDVYDNILPQYGVPKELKYLSVIESHLQTNLVSWAGAVGPWQLMDYEAHRFGLHTGKFRDERTDLYKSTEVAAKLIKELYDEFGDWLLVIAAYNGGAGRVRQAIEKTGSRDFWKLQFFLREETRTHVKKYIATHYLFEGGGGMTTMTAAETKIFLTNQPIQETKPINSIAEEKREQAGLDSLLLSGRYNSTVVSRLLQVDIVQFNKWNPSFDKKLAEGKPYMMYLTKEQKIQFETRKGEILNESIRLLLENPAFTTSSR